MRRPWNANRAQRSERRAGVICPTRRRQTEADSRIVLEAHLMTGIRTDLRQSLRRLFRRRGVTTMAVLTLALGIAATTTIFSIVDAALLRPLPWPDGDRLVAIHAVWPERQTDPIYATSWNRSPISWSMWQELHRTNVFDDIGVWHSPPPLILVGPREDLVSALELSSSLLTLLGARPALGRLFDPSEDDTPSRIALLTHEAWHRHFGARADMLGQTIALRTPGGTGPGTSYEVVGILAPEVRFHRAAPDVILPIGWRDTPFRPGVSAIGRVAHGTSIVQAEAVAAPIVRSLATPENQTARVIALNEDLLGHSGRPLWLLFGGAALLLLVACSSVAGLLIGDARTRRHELAVHATLGATRGRVLRQLAIEHFALACLATSLGLGLAALVAPIALASAPVGLLDVDLPAMSARVAAVAVLAGLATPLLFGIAPFLMVSHMQPSHALAPGGSRETFHRGASHGVVVAVQVALALVLVSGTVMFGETTLRLTTQPLGFDPARLGIVTIRRVAALPPIEPFDQALRSDIASARQWFERNMVMSQALLFDRVIERVAALPGVAAVAGTTAVPFDSQPRRLAVRASGREIGAEVTVEAHNVTERYFATMGIQILRGRDFEREDPQRPVVVIVSEELERRVFGGNALGQRLAWGDAELQQGEQERFDWGIVGVAANVKQRGFAEEDLAVVYFPGGGIGQLVVRTSGAPASVLPSVRQAIQDVAPELVVTSATTMDERLAAVTREERFRALLSAIFGLAALVLAAVGLYGLTTRQVAERRHEIGVRAALGARPGQVRALMLRQAMLALLIGLAAGAPAAFAVSQLAESFLYGISPGDPRLLLTAAGVLSFVAIAATALPAHRASRIDPSVTLRE
jgi:putative ABC transport system permease protein